MVIFHTVWYQNCLKTKLHIDSTELREKTQPTSVVVVYMTLRPAVYLVEPGVGGLHAAGVVSGHTVGADGENPFVLSLPRVLYHQKGGNLNIYEE